MEVERSERGPDFCGTASVRKRGQTQENNGCSGAEAGQSPHSFRDWSPLHFARSPIAKEQALAKTRPAPLLILRPLRTRCLAFDSDLQPPFAQQQGIGN